MADGSETDCSCFIRIGACFLLSLIYIASLYVWNSPQERDHPETIKRRFLSVFVMTFISPLFIHFFSSERILEQASLWQLLGLRKDGLLAASTLPLFLTMSLFLGPIVMQGCSVPLSSYLSVKAWLPDATNLIWLRNQVVAPLSEEFTFRACMLPLLLHCLRPSAAIILCPLIFGVAHFHHMVEKIRLGVPFKAALYGSCFQFLYTTLFGAYSAFLFVRTGHLIAPFLAHSFCNHMGFPDFPELFAQRQPYRTLLMVIFAVGLALWALLLMPITQPALYSNKLFWIQDDAGDHGILTS